MSAVHQVAAILEAHFGARGKGRAAAVLQAMSDAHAPLADPGAISVLHALWRGTHHTDVEGFALVIRACEEWTAASLATASDAAGQLQILDDLERTLTGRRL